MLTIGSTPDPGALHLTQGVVRVVVVGGGSVLNVLLFIYAYLFTQIYIQSMQCKIIVSKHCQQTKKYSLKTKCQTEMKMT